MSENVAADLIDLLRLKIAALPAARAFVLGGRAMIDLGPAGRLVLDGRLAPITISVAQDGDGADCTLTIAPDAFRRILRGELDVTRAFMAGDIRISGDLAVAGRLRELVQRLRAGAPAGLQG
jgi:ubiquinone biosynthesis protein UbiJ